MDGYLTYLVVLLAPVEGGGGLAPIAPRHDDLRGSAAGRHRSLLTGSPSLAHPLTLLGGSSWRFSTFENKNINIAIIRGGRESQQGMCSGGTPCRSVKHSTGLGGGPQVA